MKALLGALLLLCATAGAGVEDNIVHVAGFNYQVVMKGTGSGFITRSGYVVTAAHVATMAQTLRVRDSRGAWHNATVVKRGKPDWAILSVPTLKGEGIPIDRDGVQQGESMWAYGRFSEGLKNCYGVSMWGTGEYGQASTPVYPGYSGGPVLDAQGEVVGVVSMSTCWGTCFYVRVSDIR